jgi:hypothetical protein
MSMDVDAPKEVDTDASEEGLDGRSSGLEVSTLCELLLGELSWSEEDSHGLQRTNGFAKNTMSLALQPWDMSWHNEKE